MRTPFVVAKLVCSPVNSVVALTGACTYLAGFTLPFRWDVPLMVLAVSSVCAAALRPRRGSQAQSPVVVPVLLLLAATCLSTLISEDVSRSVRFSAPLLPAVLVFFLITDHFDGVQHVRLLYITLSIVALALGSVLLWTAWQVGWQTTHLDVRAAGSPIFVVPNDVTLLAILTPISLALLYLKPWGISGILAALSIFVSAFTACVLQSRVALLTLIGSVACTATALRPRLALACATALVFLVLLVDAALNFPLLAKFGRIPDPRIALWLASWSMFLDAPWLGHGPHTFRILYQPYLRDVALPSSFPVDDKVVPWPHNLYLEFLSEQGIIGLAVLACLLIGGLAAAWRTRHASLEQVRVLGAAAFVALAGFSFAALLELTFLRKWVVITLFTLVGLSARLSVLGRQVMPDATKPAIEPSRQSEGG